MIDTSIGLGTGKILAVLALDARHHQHIPSAPGLQNVRCVAVSVASTWTGDTIAAFLRRVIAIVGRPVAYLKDGGSDLQKAIRLLEAQGLASPSIDDVSHVIANLLKRRYHDHPMFETFLSACSRISANLKQTILACLIPPKVQTKARFMNVHRLVAWADRILKLSPPGGAAKGSTLYKLRACLTGLPACKPFIKSFREDAAPLLECEKILKIHGLSQATLLQCMPFIEAIHSGDVRHDFADYLHRQLETAMRLGLDDDKIGMPISSDQIESLFGLAKQHGVGEIKDAGRIAIRLPAMCGVPTRVEAEQVLGISIAEQHEAIGRLTSLMKQRRKVLSNPESLETLAEQRVDAQIALISSVKNRSKNLKTPTISACYENMHGPELNENQCAQM